MIDQNPVSRRPVGAGPGAAEPGAAGGFTLVEVLVALVVTGILAGGVISLLLRQNEFYGETDDLVFAEQSLRATADLVASELRGSAPEDIVEAGQDRLTFHYDLVRAVVCDVNSTTNDVYYYVVAEADNANVGAMTGFAYRNPYSSTGYTYDSDKTFSESVASSTTDAIATTCSGDGGPTVTSSNVSKFRVVSWDAGTLPADGAYLRFFGQLTYEFKASGFAPDATALYRENQELASPFKSDAGFTYVMAGGAEVTSTTNYADIRRIRISATAIGDGANRHDVERSLDFDIPLRNRNS